jgi:hypothetical protein
MLLIPLPPVSIITSTVRLYWGYKQAVTLAPPTPTRQSPTIGKIFESRQKDFLGQIIHSYVHRTTSYSLFCFKISHMLSLSVFLDFETITYNFYCNHNQLHCVSIFHYVFTWCYRQKTGVFIYCSSIKVKVIFTDCSSGFVQCSECHPFQVCTVWLPNFYWGLFLKHSKKVDTPFHHA